MHYYAQEQQIDFPGLKMTYILSSLLLIVFLGYQTQDPLLQAGIAAAILLLIYWILFHTRAEFRLDSSGIRYQIHGLFLKPRHIPAQQIASIKLKKSFPISDYGGWGIRWKKGEWAYILQGDYVATFTTVKGNKTSFSLSDLEQFRMTVETLFPEKIS